MKITYDEVTIRVGIIDYMQYHEGRHQGLHALSCFMETCIAFTTLTAMLALT